MSRCKVFTLHFHFSLYPGIKGSQKLLQWMKQSNFSQFYVNYINSEINNFSPKPITICLQNQFTHFIMQIHLDKFTWEANLVCAFKIQYCHYFLTGQRQWNSTFFQYFVLHYVTIPFKRVHTGLNEFLTRKIVKWVCQLSANAAKMRVFPYAIQLSSFKR